MRTTSPDGANNAIGASGASTTPTRSRAVWAVGGAVGIGAILMGASVASATFQSRPQSDAAVIVSATYQSQKSAAPTVRQLPNAPIPQTGVSQPSSTVVIGGDQPTITLPPAPTPTASSLPPDAAALDVTDSPVSTTEPSTEAPLPATPTEPAPTDPGTPARRTAARRRRPLRRR